MRGLYKLPSGWRWVKLSHAAMRKFLAIKPNEQPDRKFVYLGLENVKPGQWYEPNYSVVLGKEIKSQVLSFWPGLVLYGRLRPYLNKVVIPTKSGVASTEFVPILPDNRLLCPEYLGAYLRSPQFLEYANRNTNGSRQPRLRVRALWDTYIPLPPLEEQRRIVRRINELLGKVREARRLLEEAKKDVELLWKATLASVFPRPGQDLPHGWKWKKLKDLFDIQQGAAMSPERRLGKCPKPFLRTRNIHWGEVDISSIDFMDFTEEEVKRLQLRNGDLLVCEGGEVGRTALWNGQLPLALFQNHIHRLRAKTDFVKPEFVLYWMQAAYRVFHAYKGEESKTAIPNLSKKRLGEFLIPLPSIKLQVEIISILEYVYIRIKQILSSEDENYEILKALKQYILKSAFYGLL